MPRLRRRPRLHQIPLELRVPAAGLPGGVNPPATWAPPGSNVGWLNGMAHQMAPTIAMAQTGAALVSAAADAKQYTGRAWTYVFHTHTTIPKRR